ncbi:ubiquitin-conjugating enzyme-like protein [Leptomonas seymouri]|uniref:Ubiquitin-conjugating enzyme-like protein n=1 Tax=Leptomonas seymouri TaxID=5684 RepID=A0A0N1HXA7_LEPSE|nr:ubiquitin-conjugating enzyme-like protein [Leptomonas seymouri]|eukprot:KPI85818.1 ubiquitin-conjugating enzyme-like protein [Leptomonas seymouri]
MDALHPQRLGATTGAVAPPTNPTAAQPQPLHPEGAAGNPNATHLPHRDTPVAVIAEGVPAATTVEERQPEEVNQAARQSRNHEGAARMGGTQKLRDHQTAQRRLMQDYRQLQKNLAEGSSFGIMATPVDNNFFHWHAVISGPCDTPWEGGLFKLDMLFGDDYPFTPPMVRFRTKNIFHPNVYVDGNICMDTMKSNWQASLNIEALLISIQSLLCDPNPNSAANGAAARLLTENRSAYDEKIRSLAEESLNQTFSDMDDEEDDDGEGSEH